MAHLRLLPLSIVASALLCCSALMAQSVAPAARIVASVDETSLTTLKGNVPARARAEYDQGEASSSTQMTHVRLVLSRSSDQQAALDAYLVALQDKSSPNYHKWLTPEQFGSLYGPAASDVSTIVAWLESHGLKLEAVSAGRTNIAFSGSVNQMEEAFHTTIHTYSENGVQFYSNTTDPQIPSALGTVVKGVARLNTVKPKPQYTLGRMGTYDPSTGTKKALTSSEARVRPELTYEDSSGDQYLYVVPADAATIYNTPNSTLNANYTSGTSYTGSGVTIGIGGDSAITSSYVTAYRSLFLGDTTAPTITNINSVAENSDAIEAYLDVEVSGGLAPGATIHLYVDSDLFTAVERAISDNTVDIFSLSFGECEQYLSTSDNQYISGLWEQAASQGIAVTVSTGDSGSAGCDYPTDSSGNNVTAATGGLGVNALASTPYNIAVGGTDYPALLTSFSTYVTPATSKSSAKGSASTYYRTALSYIPEATWNDSTETNTTISANIPWTAVSGYTSYANIVGGSGGKSSCSANSTTYSGNNVNVGTCSSGYSKPTWQTGTGVPSDGVRDLPDISLLAADGMDGATWLICYPYTSKGTTTQLCVKDSSGSWSFAGVGGTSASAPAFAGILALVQQKTGSRLGQAAANLYSLYNGSHSSAIFHDVTTGNIAVPCTSGTTNCTKNSAGYYYESGYDTTTGYDLATGLGSVDATQLVNYWSTATGAAAATVTITSASSVTTADSLTVSGTVTGSNGAETTPSGTVTITGGSYTSPAQTLSGGSYSFPIPAGSLAMGSVSLKATYNGDTIYASAYKSTTVQVNGLTPTVTVVQTALSVNSNQSVTVTGKVLGTATTPTGTVTLTGGGYTSAAATLSSGNYSITIPAYSLSAGIDTLTVSYSGDTIYTVASNSTTLTVVKSTFALSAGNISSLTAGSSIANSVTVTGAGGYVGAVTLTASVSPSGTTAPTITISNSPVTLSATTTTGTGTVTVGTNATTTPSVKLARNSGAGWFKAAGGTAIAALLFFFLPLPSKRWRQMLSAVLLAVAVSFAAVGCGGGGGSGTTTTKLTPTVTVKPAYTTIDVTDALSVAVTVTGSGSTPTGTVTLTSGSYSTSGTLASGASTITIPANSLTAGATDTLTVAYGGDTNYNSASGTATITVKAATTAGTYTVTVTGTGNDSVATTNTATFTVIVN